MKISEIDRNVKMVDMENFLDVTERKDGVVDPYVYNLNETIYLDKVPILMTTVSHDMFWTTLSFQLYGTTRLWWVLMKVNGVKPDSTFEPIHSGDTVFYVNKDDVATMLKMGLST